MFCFEIALWACSSKRPVLAKVFVGGIPRTATEAEVKEFAEQVGQVNCVSYANMDDGSKGGK